MSPTSLATVLHIQVRPKCGPLAYRSYNSAWGMWTSTVSMPDAGMVTAGTSSGISSMGDLGELGAKPLKVLGGIFADSSHEDNGGPGGLSTPMMIALELEQGCHKLALPTLP